MRRLTVFVMLACFTVLFLLTAQAVAMALISALDPHHRGDSHRRVLGRGQIRFDGAGPEKWALRFREERRLVDRLRRRLARQRYVVLHDPSVVEAIGLAAATYGHGDELWRKAACESRMNPGARNLSSAASGLYQFLPGTFASTPYGSFSIFSPYANALAAGWMHSHGRGNEWSCR
jgi:hypothetical protein